MDGDRQDFDTGMGGEWFNSLEELKINGGCSFLSEFSIWVHVIFPPLREIEVELPATWFEAIWLVPTDAYLEPRRDQLVEVTNPWISYLFC